MSGKHVKDLFSQTTIYGIGLFANKAISFILLPLYTYYFAPAELGVYNLVQSVWLFVILIYLYGQETAFIKFFIDGRNDEEKKTVYSTTLIMLVCSSLVFSLIIYFLSPSIASLIRFENPELGNKLLRILALLLFTDTLFRFPLLLIRAELKAKSYLYLTLLSVLANVSANFILIVGLKMGVEAIFYSYIISVIITFIAGLLATGKYLSLRFSFDTAKKLAAYGNKFIYIGLFVLLIDVSDRFFLKYFFNEEVVGIYSANYRLASVMSLIVAAFRFSWTPYFLNLEKNPENKKIISDIFTYLVFTGMLLFLFFSFFTEPIVKISFGKFSLLDFRYRSGLSIIPIVLLAYFFSGMYSALSVAPFYANKTGELFFVTWLGFAVNMIFNFILIPKFIMMGAALSTLITYLVMLVYLYFRSQKIYKIDFESSKILIITAFAGICYFLYYLSSSYFDNTILMIISFFLITFFILFLNLLHVVKLTAVKTIFTRGL
ncbi:MAG: oligosaccharide flippase family protein [Ignavibacteria bacterium]|nr:oligosaccharide flippase family protein [Ignavibacteria bacterium]